MDGLRRWLVGVIRKLAVLPPASVEVPTMAPAALIPVATALTASGMCSL